MGLSLEKSQKLLSLEKEIEQHAPHMLTLVKTAQLTLEKKGLLGHTAQVALVLDISGSMSSLYQSGKVQRLVERALALASRFDDNGAIDVFLFGERAHNVGELRVASINGYVTRLMKQYALENATNYGRAMQAVLKHYFPAHRPGQVMKASLPVYVLFVTDGAAADKALATRAIQDASYLPVFWEFVGIGHSNRTVDTMLRAPQDQAVPKAPKGFLARLFGASAPPPSPARRQVPTEFAFLEQLDTLSGRFVDNAGFFSVMDPAEIQDDDLYELLTYEYPEWVTTVRVNGLLPPDA